MALRSILEIVGEELGLEIAQRARELAEFAGRKTVTDRDIKLAYKQWRRQ